MTPEDLANLKKLCEEATPPEWKWDCHGCDSLNSTSGGTIMSGEDMSYIKTADAKFIAASRTFLPQLIEAYEALQAKCDKLEAENKELRTVIRVLELAGAGKI